MVVFLRLWDYKNSVELDAGYQANFTKKLFIKEWEAETNFNNFKQEIMKNYSTLQINLDIIRERWNRCDTNIKNMMAELNTSYNRSVKGYSYEVDTNNKLIEEIKKNYSTLLVYLKTCFKKHDTCVTKIRNMKTDFQKVAYDTLLKLEEAREGQGDETKSQFNKGRLKHRSFKIILYQIHRYYVNT